MRLVFKAGSLTGLIMSFVSTAALAEPPSAEALQKLAGQRIFFAHQSVGADVLDGVAQVAGGALRVVEGDAAALESPALVHARVGKNEAPLSKVAHFEQLMESVGPRADVALYKLCYVDFDASTDAAALFKQYDAAHQRLKAKFPAVTFVHVTAPLTTVQTGLKGWLKNVAGQGARGERENVKRQQFNELMRAAYAKEPLFDLAKLESTRADGTANVFERGGAKVPALVPEYTDDGGHLNAAGRKRVAEVLLSYLASLPPAPKR